MNTSLRNLLALAALHSASANERAPYGAKRAYERLSKERKA